MNIICYRFHLSLEQSIFMSNAKEVYGKDPETIKANKNQLFLNALYKTVNNIEDLSENTNYNARIVYNNHNKKRILLRFGILGKSKIVDKDLTTKSTIPNWQNYINIFISADKSCQIIGIEEKRNLSFNLVKELLFDPIKKQLSKELIDLHIIQITKESSFWNFINMYEGQIKYLSVTLYAPNMRACYAPADEFLEQVRGAFLADKVNLSASINPKSKGSLVISEEDRNVEAISRIISSGHGEVELKAKDPKTQSMACFNSKDKSIASTVKSSKIDDTINNEGEISDKTQVEEIFDKIDNIIL